VLDKVKPKKDIDLKKLGKTYRPAYREKNLFE
jgi:hypothetical protein